MRASSYSTTEGVATGTPAERLVQQAFLVLHDCVAHPLIGITGGARWAYRLHDRISDFCSAQLDGLERHGVGHLEGPADMVDSFVAFAESSGLHVRVHRDGEQVRCNFFRSAQEAAAQP